MLKGAEQSSRDVSSYKWRAFTFDTINIFWSLNASTLPSSCYTAYPVARELEPIPADVGREAASPWTSRPSVVHGLTHVQTDEHSSLWTV